MPLGKGCFLQHCTADQCFSKASSLCPQHVALVRSGCGVHPGFAWQNSGGAFCLQQMPLADADDGRRVLVIRGVCVEGQNR